MYSMLTLNGTMLSTCHGKRVILNEFMCIANCVLWEQTGDQTWILQPPTRDSQCLTSTGTISATGPWWQWMRAQRESLRGAFLSVSWGSSILGKMSTETTTGPRGVAYQETEAFLDKAACWRTGLTGMLSVCLTAQWSQQEGTAFSQSGESWKYSDGFDCWSLADFESLRASLCSGD